jgi:alanine racemase
MAIVKANAYGHGVSRVAQALHSRVEIFGVANVTEAHELRAHVRDTDIFILGPALPEERAAVVAGGYIPTVSDLREAAAYSALGGKKRVDVHLTIDTGMGRMGVWHEDALSMARAIRELPGIEIAGVGTHLPVADEDDAFTTAQLARFGELMGQLRSLGLRNVVDHAENSAAVIAFPAQAGDMVRVGLALYGSAPRKEFQSRLQPVMTWKSRVTLVRDVGPGRSISYGRTYITPHAMRIATLGVGYADGYRRHLSNRGADVLIGGRRRALLGRVTMDQMMVDVTGLPNVDTGEEAVLMGRQGEEEISAAELAFKAGTIPWEIFTGIGPRVERVYV